jgi:hypothetical protein
MKFYSTSVSYILKISPMIPRHSGTYNVEVTLSDGYAQPFLGTFKVIVEDVLASARTKNGKGLKDVISDDKKRKTFDIIKGTYKIRKITKNAKMTVKFISANLTQELVKRADQSSFIVNWIREGKDPVPINFTINQTSLKDQTMIFKLIFPSPKLVSASTVIIIKVSFPNRFLTRSSC